MGQYPEHEKLAAVQEQSQTIGEFLDLGPWTLCRAGADGRYHPVPIHEALAAWFEIDQNRIDDEKRAMLAAIRGGA